MINFDNYCFNYFNNKLNIPLIHTKNQNQFNILFNKIINSQLQFTNTSNQTFNKYLYNLPIETGRLFNKVLIFQDFEQSNSIRSKIAKSTHQIYNYYKVADLYNNQLLQSFYTNYSSILYNIGSIAGTNSNEIAVNSLLLEELFINIFKNFLSILKNEILKEDFNPIVSLTLDKTILSRAISQNLIIQNTSINNQRMLEVLNLLNDEFNLIDSHVQTNLLNITKKTIINLIEGNLQAYLIYNLICNIGIIKTDDIIGEQKNIQNNLVNYFLQNNNDIFESFQFIAAQFKTNPLLFVNSLKISHSYAIDMLDLNLIYDFSVFRDTANAANLNYIRSIDLKSYLNNRSLYLLDLAVIVKHTIQNYLITYIDILLSSEYISNIIVNKILPKLTTLSPNAMTFHFPIVNYIKLLYVNLIYSMNFTTEANIYKNIIDNLDFDMTTNQVNSLIDKTEKSLYISQYNQNSKLKNFYASSISNTISNIIIDKYRI